MSQANSNREIITEAIVRYMGGLPEPKTVPHAICVEIRFEEATEVHVIEMPREPKEMSLEKMATDIIKAEAAREVERIAEKEAERILGMYHEICKELPKVRVFTDARKKMVRARRKKYSREEFKELFEKTAASDFLCGSNDRKWTANFDWLMIESNMAKVLEGNYDNKRACREVAKPQSFNTDEAFEKALKRSYGT